MGRSSKVGLAALGIAVMFTFTLGASAAGTLTVRDDEAAGTPPPSAATIPTPAAFARAELGELPPPQARTELDPNDPWTSRKFSISRAPKKSKPRPLDSADPWATSSERGPSAVAGPPTAAPAPTPSKPSTPSDDALREAIKHAIDTGDLDRASELLEILRTPR